ncbi:MAG: LysM peptidoglycan-binding domain-containing protein [Verrucomicrobiae bacterium]|nr:LysM peptidoglycan-binding domain-containing protein [Verrucomicrobiae bacterium]
MAGSISVGGMSKSNYLMFMFGKFKVGAKAGIQPALRRASCVERRAAAGPWTRLNLFVFLAVALAVGHPAAAELTREQVSLREDVRGLLEKTGQMQMDLQAMKAENEALRAENERLRKDVAALRENNGDWRKETSRLDEMIRKLDAARENDRKVVVDEVGKELERVMKKAAATGGSDGGREKPAKTAAKPKVVEGREHVVEKGQTLNAIAEAYGVSKKAIMEANNLSKSELKIGQKLFIPMESKPSGKRKKKSEG